ncbi:hypothetical protein Scep_013269 [Stephania cephalantha]|uniref:Wound-responsive family protein n=1 Tax=Stephania cephalantha TaxID=152367 RepID=A0AAP0JI25_9MAGN
MSGTSRAWIVAASLGAVEALKDQGGLCRWNYAIRRVHQHANNHLRSMSSSQANNNRFSSSSSSSANIAKQRIRDGDAKIRESEESLRKVMYLSCWGPN